MLVAAAIGLMGIVRMVEIVAGAADGPVVAGGIVDAAGAVDGLVVAGAIVDVAGPAGGDTSHSSLLYESSSV
jgi:glycerol-3-phosphate responsive antiterminator